jgi:DNA-binding MarR family transcriptional regulator
MLNAAHRLQICAMLSAVIEAEFAAVRDAIAVSDSVLSKQLKQLEEAGYVAVRKAASAGRQRTWLSLTARGAEALTQHLRALTQMVEAARLAAQ